jgi:FKBP-type peptidyl-prolyl cis-trans isomerase FkpA
MQTKAMLAAVAVLAAAGSAHAQALKTDEDKALYVLGYSLGKDFQLTPAEMEVIKKGMQDGSKGTKAAVDQQEYGAKIQELARKRANVVADKSKKEGAAYAEKAAKEKGAQKTASGLVLIPIREGKGASPSATDTVKVHYRGTLLDGTEFDSSYKRNEPIDFPLNRVIPCWTEGVQKMKEGGKAKLVCPSDIAYGDRGSPPNIPGGSTLVFEVELLEVTKGAPQPQGAPQGGPKGAAPKGGGHEGHGH